MRSLIVSATLAIGLLMAAGAQAQAPAAVTATCKDGSTFAGKTKHGACIHHGGVKAWTTAATTPPSAGAASAGAVSPAAKPPAAAVAAPAATTAPKPAISATPVAARPGQVWVNKSSKIYHCPGDKWFGKTKSGEYLSEADAKAQGYHGVGGKACPQ